MPISSACFRDCVVRSLRLQVSGIAWFAHFVCKFPGLHGSLISSPCQAATRSNLVAALFMPHMHTAIAMLQLARHNSYIRSIILCFTTCVLQINDKMVHYYVYL